MHLFMSKVSTALAVAVACSIGLAACGSSDGSSSSSSSAAGSSATKSTAAAVAAKITFPNPGDIEKTLSKPIAATSTSDAPISYASETLDVCAIPMGSMQVVALAEGTCIITASQSATEKYLAASSQVTFKVTAQPAQTYKVTYSVGQIDRGASGSITGPTLQIVAAGASSQPVTMVPGYCSQGAWTQHGTVADYAPRGAFNNKRVEINVQSDISLDATFDRYNINHWYKVSTSSRNYGYVYETGYRDVGGTNVYSGKECGSNFPPVNAVANDCCVFTGWSDGVIANPRNDDATEDVTVTAQFRLKKFDVKYSASLGGSISGSPTQQIEWDTSAAAVTAVADNGYRFSSWSDGVTTAARTDTDVKSAIYVTARFVADSQNITVRTAGRGTVSPSGDQTVSGGSTITFTFTPASGNTVQRVVVDGQVQSGTPSSWTFRNVTGPHTLNVTFSDISAEQAACLANPRHVINNGVCYLS